MGSQTSVTRAFLRTASLVDVNDKADRIIFVVPTKTKNSVDIGRRNFLVTTTNHKGEYDRNHPVQLHDFDEAIRNVVFDSLGAKENLKLAFEAHTKPYFHSGLDWLEICSLVTAVTLRWHQRIETIAGGLWTERFSVGAPPAVLTDMGLKMAKDAREDDYHDFGGTKAVLSLDHRVARLVKARGYPIFRLGNWKNGADLAFALGMGYMIPTTSRALTGSMSESPVVTTTT